MRLPLSLGSGERGMHGLKHNPKQSFEGKSTKKKKVPPHRYIDTQLSY